MAKRLTLVILCVGGLDAVLYDCVSGKPANRTQLKIYEQRNNTGVCTVDVKPCDPEKWRRVDGSCTNLRFPSRGTHRTPNVRLIPIEFSPNYEPRKAADGGELGLARRLRTEILTTGKASDLSVTQLASYYILFSSGDINSIHDGLNYVMNISTCCKPEGRDDYRCTPITVPVDDPVHRFSGINCMNLTRPQTFQTYGCLDNGTEFTRIVFQNPVYDLSNTYNMNPGFSDRLRTFKNGLMIIEKDNGLLFPPSDPLSDLCFMNQRPSEIRCHKYRKLNMIRDGIISCDGGFRDLYDETVPPQTSDEYVYAHRWFHTIQETTMKLYDKDGCFLRTFPMANVTARPGYFTVDNNMVEFIQGSFRQPGGRFDYTIDIDMGDRVLGTALLAADVGASDLAKGRYFGFPPYIKYKEFCTKRSYKKFSDLKDHFHPERLYNLMQHHKYPSDLDLMTAMWSENYVKGGRVPEILYCLFIEQLKRTIASDRHWYERSNRPHAFNEEQLKAIRKSTLAGILCWVGDQVSEIQPSAFHTITPKNQLMNCSSSKIGKLNLAPWKE